MIVTSVIMLALATLNVFVSVRRRQNVKIDVFLWFMSAAAYIVYVASLLGGR